jgi:hypothetical protein
MLDSNDPKQAKLAVFLKNYQEANRKVDKKWMHDDQENQENYISVQGSPVRLSPTKSVGERFSPIRLREF